MNNNIITYNILGSGDSGVGQTCIIRRWIENKFIKNGLATIGIDFKGKTVPLNNGKSIKLKIWDTAGQERFWNITKQYIKGSDAIILIYDISDEQSYDNLNKWINNITNRNGGENYNREKPIFLVGNKMDLEEKRKITREQGNEFAKKNGLLFIECSAKTGENVNYIFNKLILTLLQNNPEQIKLRKDFEIKVEKEIDEIEEKYREKNRNLNMLLKYISF